VDNCDKSMRPGTHKEYTKGLQKLTVRKCAVLCLVAFLRCPVCQGCHVVAAQLSDLGRSDGALMTTRARSARTLGPATWLQRVEWMQL